MRYHCLHIHTNFAEEWQKDVFEQQLFDLGVDTIDGEDYYILSDTWAQNAGEIEDYCRSTEGVSFLQADECADKNWNAAWEAEHPVQELPLGIRIVPHCAFGAGHHETTSMLINSLLSSHLSGKNVLDYGTGTGVLAIFAKHLGAAKVVAVDIDEKSVENAKENAALNGVEIDVRQGDTPPRGTFDLILANIHRNILLANMQTMSTALNEGGELWLSGFYEEDCPALQAAAEQQGLTLTDVLANGEWRLMRCHKEVHS